MPGYEASEILVGNGLKPFPTAYAATMKDEENEVDGRFSALLGLGRGPTLFQLSQRELLDVRNERQADLAVLQDAR